MDGTKHDEAREALKSGAVVLVDHRPVDDPRDAAQGLALSTVYKALESLQNVKGGQLESTPYYATPYDTEMMSRLRKLSTAHRLCVTYKANDFVGNPPQIRAKMGEAIVAEETLSTYDEWQHSLHRTKSLSSLLTGMATDREALGWGCLEVLRNTRGEVVGLVPVPAKMIRVVHKAQPTDPTIFCQLNDQGEPIVYFQEFPDMYPKGLGGEPVHVASRTGKPGGGSPANELLWWPKSDSETRWYGVSDIVTEIPSIGLMLSIVNRNADFFENECMGRWAVLVSGATVDAETQRRIQSALRVQLKGRGHSTLILWSDDSETEYKFQRLDTDYKELDFLETTKSLDQRIIMAHGYPVFKNVRASGAEGGDEGFGEAESYVNRIVLPAQDEAEKLLRLLLDHSPCRDLGIRLDLVPPDIRSVMARARALAIYTSHGILSRDEARDEIGQARRGGDANQLVIWSRGSTPSSAGATKNTDQDAKKNPKADAPNDEPKAILEDKTSTPVTGT